MVKAITNTTASFSELPSNKSKPPAPNRGAARPLGKNTLASGGVRGKDIPGGEPASKYEMTITKSMGWMRIFFAEAVQKRPDTSTGALAGALSQLHRAIRVH